MKKTILLSTMIGTCATAQASTVLIDYIGETNSLGDHNTEVLSGGFTGLVTGNFSPWVSLGTEAVQLNTNLNGGSFSGSTNYVAEESRVLAIDTGFTLTNNDTFNIGFSWRDALSWDATGDTISVTLYYTDNDLINGTATDLVTLDSGNRTSLLAGVWEAESASDQTYSDAGAIGKNLYFRIDTNADNDEFSRVDDIFLEVTTVPEPSSTALLGLGGMALILRRRK